MRQSVTEANKQKVEAKKKKKFVIVAGTFNLPVQVGGHSLQYGMLRKSVQFFLHAREKTRTIQDPATRRYTGNNLLVPPPSQKRLTTPFTSAHVSNTTIVKR